MFTRQNFVKQIMAVVLAAIWVFSLGFTLSCATAQEREVRMIIAKGKPDSENAAYNFPAFKEYTGIDVKLEAYPYDTLVHKVGVDLATEAGRYDVIWVQGWGDVARFEPYLLDMKPLWDSLPKEYREDFFKITVDALVGPAGKMTAIPWKFPVIFLFYRKDLFEEFGLKTPETLDELREIEKKLTLDLNGDGKIDIYGGGWSGASWWGSGWKFWGLAVGFCDANIQKDPWFDADGNLTLNASWNVDALQWMVDAYAKDKIWLPESLEVEHYDLGLRFMGGITATQYEWPWLWLQAQDPKTSEVVGKVGVAPMPRGPSGRRCAMVVGQGLGISKFSKHKKEAWELVKWLCSRDALANSERYFTTESPRKSSWRIPEVAPELAKVVLEYGPTLDVTPPVYAETLRTYEIVSREIQAALMQKKNPQEALNDAQQKALEIIGE